MEIKNQVKKMDAIVAKGAIVDAVKEFFSENANTADYGNSGTKGKSEMIDKMEGFANAIEKVNSITHHSTIVEDNVSASEFTFDFNMKDGSKIYWHEIIKRVWDKEGKVIHEEYFNAE